MSSHVSVAAEEAITALGAARSHLRQARLVVEELRDVVHSALAVVEDAEVDAAQARTAERGDLYLGSTVEHLGRLRTRCDSPVSWPGISALPPGRLRPRPG